MATTANILPVPKKTVDSPNLPANQNLVTEQTSQVTPQTGAQVPQNTGVRRQSPVGLRSTLERQGYTVGYDANNNVTVNGQVVDTAGMTNVRGNYRATPDQIGGVVAGLQPQTPQYDTGKIQLLPGRPGDGNKPPVLLPLKPGEEGQLTNLFDGRPIRDVADSAGYDTSYDPNTNQVIVRDPKTGKSIQFESGQGQEYGMGGLEGDRNQVVDRDRFESYFKPAQENANSFKDAFTKSQEIYGSLGLGDTTQAQEQIEAFTGEVTSGIEQYMGKMDEYIQEIKNTEDTDTQAMVVSYLNRTMDIYDQMARQLEQEKAEGMDDPGLQSALAMMKDEYSFMREQMLSNLRARGMDSGSELARAESRMGKGYMNSRQQMIGNFMSQLNSRVNQGLMQLMGQRAATMTHFGGIDINQASEMADRRMNKMLTIMDALGGMADLKGKVGEIKMQGLGAVESLKQSDRSDLLGMAGTIYEGERADKKFDETMDFERTKMMESIRQWGKEIGLKESDMKAIQDRFDKEYGLKERQQTGQEARDKETIRSNKATEALRQKQITATENANKAKASGDMNEYEKFKLEAMKYEMSMNAVVQSNIKYESALKETPPGGKETYEEMIASRNNKKQQIAYDYLKQFATYDDPVTNRREVNMDVQTRLDELKKILDEYDKTKDEPGWLERIIGSLATSATTGTSTGGGYDTPLVPPTPGATPFPRATPKPR